MRRVIYAAVCMLFVCMFLSGCVTSLEYRRNKAKGFYPDTSEFPDTKWVCRELDMYFYMFDHGDPTMAGKYVFDGKEYRVTANFFFSEMNFSFYSHTDVSESEIQRGYVSCERNEVDFLYTQYIYKDGIITCKIENSDRNIWKYDGDTITFEKECTIVGGSNTVYYCEELDMYISKVVDGYYKGEIVRDGRGYYVHAVEVGNGDYYEFSIENSETAGQEEISLYLLIDMFFEYRENKIIATVSDGYNAIEYPKWEMEKTTFTFVEKSVS